MISNRLEQFYSRRNSLSNELHVTTWLKKYSLTEYKLEEFLTNTIEIYYIQIWFAIF